MSTHFKKIFKENKKRADKTARKALKLLYSLIYFLRILFGEHFIILERLVLIEQFVRIGGIEADILAECIAQPVFGNDRIRMHRLQLEFPEICWRQSKGRNRHTKERKRSKSLQMADDFHRSFPPASDLNLS